jgi:hypothetical protein
MTPLSGPRLCINYAPELDLSLTCARLERYGGLASADYFFQVNCRLRHPTGYFEYFANDLYFDLDSFARFAKQLRSMRQGTANSAALENPGQMFELRLDKKDRKLQLTICVRESIPLGKLASLSGVIDVDYDLFINKLGHVLEGFGDELREANEANFLRHK